MAGMPMTPRDGGSAAMHDQLAREQAARLEAEKKMRQMEYYTKAATLKSQQQYGAAADMYEKAIQEGHPERAECHNMKGECFEELGQLDPALAEFERAVSAKRNDARFLYNRGKVYYKKATAQSGPFGEKIKQFGRAQADLESAINHVGGNHQLREKTQHRLDAIHQELTAMAADAHSRGQQLYASSDWRGAHAAFSEALSTKHGDRAQTLFQRAMCDMQNKQFDAAIKDLNETLQLQPQQPEALYQRACAWRVKRDLQKALVDMNAAAGMGHPAAAQQVAPLQQEIQAEQHFQQARQLFQRDDYQGADQMCAQALATFPAHAGALDLQKQARNAMAADMAIAHGKTLMQQAANPGQEYQYQAAAAALSEAARLLEGTRGLERKIADLQYHLAVCDVNGLHSPPPHAQGYLDKAISIDGNALYKELRGKVKYVKGDLAGAKADLVSTPHSFSYACHTTHATHRP
jgi:Tfp pilus assembly protein PilF